jgi:hypothetical protein
MTAHENAPAAVARPGADQDRSETLMHTSLTKRRTIRSLAVTSLLFITGLGIAGWALALTAPTSGPIARISQADAKTPPFTISQGRLALIGYFHPSRIKDCRKIVGQQVFIRCTAKNTWVAPGWIYVGTWRTSSGNVLFNAGPISG